jgi:serine/threonine protein kinase
MEDHARIELLQKLGSGSYGDVWVARHFETADSPTYVAVKLE